MPMPCVLAPAIIETKYRMGNFVVREPKGGWQYMQCADCRRKIWLPPGECEVPVCTKEPVN